jgi:hypothetical protein
MNEAHGRNRERTQPMRIVILEDNTVLQEAFRDVLAERFPMFELCFAVTSGECVRLIDEAIERIVLVVLDNDLDVLRTSFGKDIEPGDGIQVAEFLARRKPRFPIVVHTTNGEARSRIEELLVATGWAVTTVVPYGGQEWIPREWFRAVRNAIVESAPAREAAEVIPV